MGSNAMLPITYNSTPKNIKRERLIVMLIKGFADIHSHLLPEVDDGAADLQEACRMVRLAYENGTRAMILTPHYRGEYMKNTPELLRERLEQLQNAISEEMPDMQLYLGNEVLYQVDVFQLVESGRVLPLSGSRYVLLEFLPDALRSRVIMGVAEAVQYGFTPIIAHGELCTVLWKNTSLVDEILHMGALIQMNADSIMGKNGFSVKRFCHKLLKRHQVHFVASDAHDREARPPVLHKCFARVQKKYGEAYAERVFCENARTVMENRKF